MDEDNPLADVSNSNWGTNLEKTRSYAKAEDREKEGKCIKWYKISIKYRNQEKPWKNKKRPKKGKSGKKK